MNNHSFEGSIWNIKEQCFITARGEKWRFQQKKDAFGQPLMDSRGRPDMEVVWLLTDDQFQAGLVKAIPHIARSLLNQGETRSKMEQKIRTMSPDIAEYWNAVLANMEKICNEEERNF